MIEIKGLSTGYRAGSKEICISGSLDINLQGSQLVSLLGPNGAGKTTLLRTLAGLQSPLKGDIKICGKALKDYKMSELACTVGVVLTERPAVMSMTVREMVSMGRSPYTGFSGRLSLEDHDKVNRAMQLVGINGMAGRTVASLSDGERQKVMIAKALAQETKIIFLDEPSAFLDFPGKVEMMALLRRLAHEERKLILLSTHDLNVALAMSDTLILLSKEHGMRTGTPAELGAAGSLERWFASPLIRYDREKGAFMI